MMFRLRILALLLCLCCLNANAQQKMDSAAIARWRKSMVPVPLEEIVKTYRAYSQHLREDLPPRHLIDESAIIQTIGVDTPLLEWPGRVARWKTMGDRDELWIDSIADVERGEADSIAWQEAVHRYGCDTLYAWREGYKPIIKKTLPDGIYFCAHNRFHYMGFAACIAIGWLHIKNAWIAYKPQLPYMSNYVGRGMLLWYEEPLFNDNIHRDWQSHNYLKRAYALIAHELSMHMAKYKDTEKFRRTCFLEIKPNGTFHLHALDSDYTQEEKKTFTKLQKAASALAPHALMELYLDDGRYLPGHFVEIVKTHLPHTWRIDLPVQVEKQIEP